MFLYAYGCNGRDMHVSYLVSVWSVKSILRHRISRALPKTRSPSAQLN